MVIEAQAPCDDQVRHLEVLCFTESHNIDSAVQPVAVQADDCDPDSAAPPVEPQVNAELHDESVHSSSSDAGTIPNDDIDPEGRDLEESDIVAEQVPELIEGDTAADCAQDELDITAFEATTSAHDDWLHRGPFLFDMDFHTYMRLLCASLAQKSRGWPMQIALSIFFSSTHTTHLLNHTGSSCSLRAFLSSLSWKH